MLIQAAHRGCAAGVLVRQGANAQIYGDIPENSIVSAAKPREFFGKCFFRDFIIREFGSFCPPLVSWNHCGEENREYKIGEGGRRITYFSRFLFKTEKAYRKEDKAGEKSI